MKLKHPGNLKLKLWGQYACVHIYELQYDAFKKDAKMQIKNYRWYWRITNRKPIRKPGTFRRWNKINNIKFR